MIWFSTYKNLLKFDALINNSQAPLLQIRSQNSPLHLATK